MIEDVFKQMAAVVPALAGLTLSRIGDLGIQVLGVKPEDREPGGVIQPILGKQPDYTQPHVPTPGPTAKPPTK